MLKELQVKNFAIIDDVKINFGRGLNVLTGETGAGKTLIIEAINLLIGERADSSLIRDGEQKLLVQGYFDFSGNELAAGYLVKEKLIEAGEAVDDIVITREVNRKGKNRAFINGIFTQVSTLKNLGKCLIDIHGQHDHQYLLESKTHIEIIDKLGKKEIEKIKQEYNQSLKKYLEKKEELANLKKLQDQKEEKLSDLKYRLDEIEKLDIKENEEEILENERRVLKNYEKIYQLCSECIKIIKGSETEVASLSSGLAELERNLKELATIDNRFEKYSNEISSFAILIEELSHYLNSYVVDFEFDPQRLDYIEERLYKLSEIKKKYGMDLVSIRSYLQEIIEEIDNLESIEYELERERQRLDKFEKELIEKALQLTNYRKKIMHNLEKEVRAELVDLNFKSVAFQAQSSFIKEENGIEIGGEKVKLTKNGIDDVEFLISLNPGESVKPLKKIASGGEISRIMLALKSIIGSVDNISTMIFDEIDVGIGGETSKVVGEKLYKISRNCQVICITHLASIACFSDSHYFIDKYIEGSRTKIRIEKLDEGSRINEISRMLSGETRSSVSMMHAEELLERCSKIKNNILDGEIKIGN